MPNDQRVTELYRSPDPENPPGLARLNIDRAEVLDDEQQIELAQRTRDRTTATYQAAADRAAAAVPPLPPVVRLDLIQSRAELRTAIMHYAELHELAERADEAVQRSTARVSQADAQLQDYEGLEQRIVMFYATEAKNNTHDSLPYDLQREQQERGQIIDRVCGMRKALVQLQSEARAAHDAVKAANVKRAAAAVRIVSVEMDRLADDLAKLNSIAASMRRKLSAAAATFLPIPNATTVLALSTRATGILTAQPPPLESGSVFSQAIRNWHARLMSDSEAKLDDADDNDAPQAAA